MNTQSGSQWDGLRHFGHGPTGFYYNGTHHDDLIQSKHIGTDHWSKRGGIVGRGVLIDYAAYAERKGIKYNPMSRHCITVSDIKAIAEEENLEFQHGDILIVRSGWIKWYEGATDEQRIEKVTKGHEYVGVEGCEETLEFLWNQHFAAVAGDAIGFEAWPKKEPYGESAARSLGLVLALTKDRTARQLHRALGYAVGRVVGSRSTGCGMREAEEMEFLHHELATECRRGHCVPTQRDCRILGCYLYQAR